MNQIVTCFMLERAPRVRRALRRFRPGGINDCAAGGYCNAVTPLDDMDFSLRAILCADEAGPWPDNDDPRWPRVCPACRREFLPTDNFQRWIEWLMRDTRTGALTTLRDAEPGAMWHAWWMPEKWRGPDGLALTVKLPDGVDWLIDGPSKKGNGWTREGVPPVITARPSIETPNFHGWLTNGVISPC